MITAPFLAPDQTVEPEWIDYNGHLNMAYYNVLFDRASDHAFEAMGMGPNYANDRRKTIYIAETHLVYKKEVHAGDRVSVTFRVVDHDAKRIHGFQEMRHESGFVAATLEGLWLHIAMGDDDGNPPRVEPFPDDVREKLDAMAAAHATLPPVAGIGRSIGIGKRSAS